MNFLLAALIGWTVAGTTQNETDVKTDGRLLYAYAPRETTVNGIRFAAVPNGANFPKDISFANPVNSIAGAYWHDDQSLWKGGDAYKTLLSNGFYSSHVYSSHVQGRNQVVRLHGLVPGRKYLVQFWFSDMREPRRHSCQFAGGKTMPMSKGGNYFGSHAVGTFVASGTEQRFDLASNIEDQINAIQVRDLDDGDRTAPASALASGIADGPLARFNPTWTNDDLGVTYTAAMPTAALLGNGTLGVVNGGTADGKRFVLTRGDLWSCGAFETGRGKNPQRDILPISFADFTIEPGEGNLTYADTLDVATATLETRGTFGKNEVLLRSFVAATEDTFVVSGVATRDACWKLRLKTHDGFDCFPSESFVFGDGVGVCRRTINAAGARGWETNATAVVRAVNADVFRTHAVSSREAVAEVRLHAGQRFAFVVTSGNCPVDTASLGRLRRAHVAWWQVWWDRSRVHLNDDVLEGYYYGALYLLGSGTRTGKFPAGLYGPWVTIDTPLYQNDFHLNYNYIATYYGCYSANRPEIADTLPDPLLDYLPQAGQNALKELGRLDTHVFQKVVDNYVRGRKDLANGIPEAALFPVTVGPWGTAPAGDTCFWCQTLNGPFSTAAVCTYWEYTLDRAYLRKVWPLLDRVANFYLAWCEKEPTANGGYRYVLWDAWAEDASLRKNCAETLGPVRYLFETLVSVEPVLKELGIDVPAEKFARWRDFADNLSDLPTGLTKAWGRDIEVFSSVESGNARAVFCAGGGFELESVIPGEAFSFDVSEKLKAVATNTVSAKLSYPNGLTWESINQTTKLYAMAIRAGYPAAPIIEAFKKWEIERRAVKNFTLNDRHHGIEKAGAMEFINSMLIQSDHGFVKVFPNWIGTDASFERLRAKGAFVVSAEMRAGKVRRVTVKSEKGGTFRLVDPFGGKVADFPGLRHGQTRFSREATLEFDLRAGETREWVREGE